jgi:hypothetical protein
MSGRPQQQLSIGHGGPAVPCHWGLQQQNTAQNNVANLASLGLIYSQLAQSQQVPQQQPVLSAPAPSSISSSAPPAQNNNNNNSASSSNRQVPAQQTQQQRMQDTLLQLSQAQQLQYQIQQHQNKLQQQLADMNGPNSNTLVDAAPMTGSMPIPSLPTAASTSIPVTLSQPDSKAQPPNQQKHGQKRKASSTSTKMVGQKELKAAYERHIRSQPPPAAAANNNTNGLGVNRDVPAAVAHAASLIQATTQQMHPRTEEDKAAGNVLFGFLLSLRQSYEDALRNGNDSSQEQRLARVSDDSNADSGVSNQPESSVEDSDWNSDKKTEPSSSEDSDKEERSTNKKAKVSSSSSAHNNNDPTIPQNSRSMKHDDHTTRRHGGSSHSSKHHGENNRQGTHHQNGDRLGIHFKKGDCSNRNKDAHFLSKKGETNRHNGVHHHHHRSKGDSSSSSSRPKNGTSRQGDDSNNFIS